MGLKAHEHLEAAANHVLETGGRMCLVNQVENESKRMKLFPYEELPSFAEGRQDQAYLASHMATPLAPAYGNQVKQANANEPFFDPDMRGSEDIHAPSQAAEKRKGNKLAVRRYRQKKKQELKSLLDGEWSKKKKENLIRTSSHEFPHEVDRVPSSPALRTPADFRPPAPTRLVPNLVENAYLKERVRKLEGALEQKLEGDDLFSCLRKEDSLKLEKLSTLVATINAMTAAQQPSSAVGQSLGQSGTGSDQTQCKSA